MLKSVTTPGRMRSSSSALRPMIDRLSICFERENAFASARLRLNHFLLRGDRDGLGLLADLELDVDTARVVRAQRESSAGRGS